MAQWKVTNAELDVLRVLWQKNEPRTLADIRQVLAEEMGWKATTVKTLLYNLRDKGAVEETQRGVYRPVAKESDITSDLVNKLFGGSTMKLVASLIESDELSESDISELRAMLNRGEPDAD